MSTVLIRREYWEADVYTCCACVIHRGKTQEDTVRRWSSPSQGERPQRKPSLQPLEWRARKFLLFRPPRLWYCCGSPGTLNMWVQQLSPDLLLGECRTCLGIVQPKVGEARPSTCQLSSLTQAGCYW